MAARTGVEGHQVAGPGHIGLLAKRPDQIHLYEIPSNPVVASVKVKLGGQCLAELEAGSVAVV